MEWKGVMPAITTCFDENLQIDHEFTAKHVKWLVEHGSTGIVTNGSLGEGATLTFDEKVSLWKTCVEAVGDKVPIIPAIAALSTENGIKQAKTAQEVGCDGLMVLPPYVHKGDQREMLNHVSEIFGATSLSAMLYNNPIAYGTDFTPEAVKELANKHSNLQAVKESSGDVRRITAIKALLGDRVAVFAGLDDVIVEGINAGATGWIAGLVNAMPRESVDLFNFALNGETEKTFELYRWFLPLLRLDTVPKFVQLIKLVQEKVEMGNARVRPPRLEIVGEELEQTMQIIDHALKKRPNSNSTATVAK